MSVSESCIAFRGVLNGIDRSKSLGNGQLLSKLPKLIDDVDATSEYYFEGMQHTFVLVALRTRNPVDLFRA